jgi:hypothetical protein
MELEKLGIGADIAKDVVEGVSNGEYNLLLGAGFSRSALGGDKKSLPTAWELSSQLRADFKLPVTDDELKNLALVFDEARATVGDAKLISYIRRRFTDCSPTWHVAVLRYYWRRIWTLNIDDILDRAA